MEQRVERDERKVQLFVDYRSDTSLKAKLKYLKFKMRGVVLPKALLTPYYFGSTSWVEMDGHTGCKAGFTSGEGSRYEVLFDDIWNLDDAFSALLKVWKVDCQLTQSQKSTA